MSRIGRLPISIPKGVTVRAEGATVRVEGPKGKDSHTVPAKISVSVADGTVTVQRADDDRQTRALHGLTRQLLSNSVTGVSTGFTRVLEIVGVGYRAEVKGRAIHLSLGYSHPIEFPLPTGISARVEKQTRTIQNYIATLIISGADRQLVGQVAADSRALRRPDAYKGKGIRYAGEVIRLKVGKKGA